MTSDRVEEIHKTSSAELSRRKERFEDVLRAYKAVYATDDGKVVLQHIVLFGNLYGSSNHSDINQTIRLEGRRDVALFILHLVDTEATVEDQLEYIDRVMSNQDISSSIPTPMLTSLL